MLPQKFVDFCEFCQSSFPSVVHSSRVSLYNMEKEHYSNLSLDDVDSHISVQTALFYLSMHNPRVYEVIENAYNIERVLSNGSQNVF